MADCASSSRAVIAQSDPNSRPTACSVPVALPVKWTCPKRFHARLPPGLLRITVLPVSLCGMFSLD